MELNPALICHMYYEERLTQQQIANTLGCSRIQVSRMLQQARTDGIVTIAIRYDNFHPELEARLSARHSGTAFKIVDSFAGSSSALHRALGVATGRYLEENLPPHSVVAVGWGSTLRAVAEEIPPDTPAQSFLPLVGGQASLGLEYHANAIASIMSTRTGAGADTLLAPAVAASRSERDAFISASQVRDVVDKASRADVAVFSVGSPLSPSSSLSRVGYFSQADIKLLKEQGAACDIISAAYFNEEGEACAQDLAGRMVGVSAAQLLRIDKKICVAGGADKAVAVGIAIANGYVDTMITDVDLAEILLHS